MITGIDLNQYINKVIYIKTINGLYLSIEDVSETNYTPTFVFVNDKLHASEFVLSKKSESNVSIRLNNDMKNQNNTFGYHLYVLPDSDIVFGAGNDEIFAQFQLDHYNQYILIKSAHKNTYLCSEYNILRNRPRNDTTTSFTIEYANIPFVQRSVCVISYGYARKPMDINRSPIINTLKEIYPRAQIDMYIFMPEMMDEFYNASYDTNSIVSPKCNISVTTHKYDAKHFMKIAHSHGMSIISNKNKLYTFRTLSMLWNITEAVRNVIATKKVYNTYILMRNDMFSVTNIFRKLLDTNKLYCMNNGKLDSHLFIGKEITHLNYLYDFYMRNKLTYADEYPDKIIYDFLTAHNIQLGNIHHLSPLTNYPINPKKYDDAFYKTVIAKYQEVIKLL